MRRLELFALAFAAGPAWAQLPATVTLDEALSIVARSPRVVAAERDADAARAERVTAGALPNPNFSLGTSRLAGGERTVFDANSQQQATVELPIPVFGQREARVRAAERQVGRADSQVRLTVSETRRQAALEFARLLQAQEGLAARRAALGEIERIRGLVSGRLESGMASRYDLARADAELALAGVAVQRAEAEVSGHAAALAALADASGWRPRAAGALQAMQVGPGSQPDAEAMLAANPAARVARDDSAAAEARIELARRERLPVPSVSFGRSWTSGPFGGLEDKARADAAAARERERAANAALRAEYQKQRDALQVRRDALRRFDADVSGRQGAFLEMAESAYRLGRGTLFELLDARRTQLEAAVARLELLGAIVEAELELRALAGEL